MGPGTGTTLGISICLESSENTIVTAGPVASGRVGNIEQNINVAHHGMHKDCLQGLPARTVVAGICQHA